MNIKASNSFLFGSLLALTSQADVMIEGKVNGLNINGKFDFEIRLNTHDAKDTKLTIRMARVLVTDSRFNLKVNVDLKNKELSDATIIVKARPEQSQQSFLQAEVLRTRGSDETVAMHPRSGEVLSTD
jgi:hypothetical protein